MAKETKTTETPAEEVKAEAVATETVGAAEETKTAKKTKKADEKVAEEKEAAKPKAKKETKAKETIEDDFDWDAFETKGFGEGYSKKQREDLSKIYEDTLTTIEEKKVVKGTVVSMTDRDVVLNIGFKSDGLVSASEFRDLPDMKIGDEVEVYIEEQENAQGQLVLSRRKAKVVQAWDSIQGALDNDKVIEGYSEKKDQRRFDCRYIWCC